MRPARALIHLDALRHNYRLARELGMSEYEARQLLEQSKQQDGSPTEVDGDQE